MFDSTDFIVESLVRWADQNLLHLTVAHKGDRTRGLILLHQELRGGGHRFWVQRRDELGHRAFTRRFSEDVTTEDANAFVKREISRDDDLWVLVLEQSDGTLPPVVSEIAS